MAGDWIKMRGNLWDDPRVSALVDATDSSEAAVVGALYWLWASADQHTEDGVMPGLTLRQIDRKTGVPGFAAALCVIGWIADHPEGIRIVKFEDHNGTSAKRRSEDAKRKAGVRKVSDKVKTPNGVPSDILGRLAELEKELEIEKEKNKKKTRGGEGEKSATRIPPNFEPNPEPEAEDGIDRQKELENFRDYWTAKAGKDAAKLDWQAEWRRWARKADRPGVSRFAKPAPNITVPSKPGRDPEIEKAERDMQNRVAPSAETLAAIARIKQGVAA